MEKIEVILTNCIDEVKSGQFTLEECLERYPSRRQELEPLLRLALNIQKPPELQLDRVYKQAARDQLLRQIRNAGQRRERSFFDLFSFGISPRLGWARVAVAVLIGIVVISMAGGGTAYAAQSSLPGELLYTVKKDTEDVRLWLADDSVKKADLNMEFSQNRLDEMNELANGDSENLNIAIAGYQDNLQSALSNVEGITDPSLQTDILKKYSLKLENQISYCDEVVDISTLNGETVQEANNIAVNQQIETLKKLAQTDSMQAIRINLDMMQNRLQRAQEKADDNEYPVMQEIILQYQNLNQLGLQFVQSTQVTQGQATEIGDIIVGATGEYLEILDSVSLQVPQQYRNVLETSMELTQQYQAQAGYHFQHQGGSGQESNPSNPGTGNNLDPSSPSQPQGDTGNNTSSGPGDGDNKGTDSVGGDSDDGNMNRPDASPGTGVNEGNGYGNGDEAGENKSPEPTPLKPSGSV